MSKKTHHNVIFKVYGKNGKLIEKAAYKIEEYEVLFKSHKTFVVKSVEKVDHPLISRALKGDEVIEIILIEK